VAKGDAICPFNTDKRREENGANNDEEEMKKEELWNVEEGAAEA
jgi:hypothetical protein